jgi:hypothetical protein
MICDMKRLIALTVALLVVGLIPASAGTREIPHEYKEGHLGGPSWRGNDPWAAMARNRAELQALWRRYDQPGRPPVIRFEENIAILSGFSGSSGCHAHLHDLRLDASRKRIVARVYNYGGPKPCTDDFAPFTNTVRAARRDLRPFRAGELRVTPRRIEDPNY